MKFQIGPGTYSMEICRGKLISEGRPAGAVTHEQTILLSGDLYPHERAEVLFDQLRRLWEQHHGAMRPEGIGAFAVVYSRQLHAQGGERALRELAPTPTPRRNAKRPRGKGGAMKFRIGPYSYRIEICRGRLVVAGVECDAATLDDAIIVCGELDPRRRLGSVAHQLHELYLVHYGHATPDAFGTFFVDVHRQLLGQGGERALEKLGAAAGEE